MNNGVLASGYRPPPLPYRLLGSPQPVPMPNAKFGGWTPAQLGSQLALWLDASDASTITLNGSNVSQWRDKSGRNFHLQQGTAVNQPTYNSSGLNSMPTISTDGDDSLTRSATAILKNVNQATIAIVTEYAAAATFLVNSSELFCSTGINLFQTRLLIGPSTGALNRQALGGRRLDVDAFAGAGSSTSSLALRGSPFFKVAQADYQNAKANHWTNGAQDMTDVAFQTAGNTSNTDALTVSLFDGIMAMPAGTKISEVLVIENTLSTDNRQRVEGYFAWRWGLIANLLATHPFRNAAP